MFATLECELFDQQPYGRFGSPRAKLAVFDYLETFYNRRRPALRSRAPLTG